jgi:predicted RNA binding protein YcfA (HicA-like mRNA interferase family)
MSDTTGSIIHVRETAQELASLKKRRRSVHPDDMHSLLSEAGFERRYGKGDHWIYTHPRRPYPLTIDPRNPLLPVYVSKAIRAIEEVLAADADEDG